MPEKERLVNFSHISDGDKRQVKDFENTDNTNQDDPPTKKAKLAYKDRKKLRGQNKSRGPTYQRDTTKELCLRIITNSDETESPKCDKDGCKFLHDVEEYLKIKPKDIGTTCYNFEIGGKCWRGATCRFGEAHLMPGGKNIINAEKNQIYQNNGPYTRNNLSKELQNSLWKKKYNFDLTEKIVSYNDDIKKNKVSIYICI